MDRKSRKGIEVNKSLSTTPPMYSENFIEGLARKPLDFYGSKMQASPPCRKSSSSSQDEIEEFSLRKSQSSLPQAVHLQSKRIDGDHENESKSPNRTTRSSKKSQQSSPNTEKKDEKLPIKSSRVVKSKNKDEIRSSQSDENADQQTSREKSPNSEKEKSSNFNLTSSIMVIFALLITIGFYYYGRHQEIGQSFNIELMINKIQELKETQFPSQDRDLWGVLKSNLKTIFTRSKSMPACLLLIASDGKDSTAKSLSVAMSTIFLSFANHTGKIVTPMDAVDLTNKNVDEAGALLFDYLERNLIDNHVALVHNVERLDGNVALNLHPFCDEASNFPKSLILFTIQNNLDDVHKRNQSAEWLADKLLNDAWNPTIGVDKTGSLISRVAVSVAKVNKEELLNNS